jgi:hypothetical protein
MSEKPEMRPVKGRGLKGVTVDWDRWLPKTLVVNNAGPKMAYINGMAVLPGTTALVYTKEIPVRLSRQS